MSLAQAESVRLHTKKKHRAFFPSPKKKLQWYSSAWVSFFFAHFYLQRSGKEWKIELDGWKRRPKKEIGATRISEMNERKNQRCSSWWNCVRDLRATSECEIVQCFSGCVTRSLSLCYVFAIAHNKSIWRLKLTAQMMRVIVCDIHS